MFSTTMNKPPSTIFFSVVDNANQDTDDHSELTEPLYYDDDDDELCHHAQDAVEDTYINYPPPPTAITNNHKLIELKLQLAQQKEMVDKISLQLKACQAENETLKMENKSLLEQVVAPTGKEEHITRRPSSSSSSRWFSTSRVRDTTTPESATGGGGSMQMLLATNATLMVDNARLQSENVNIRECFQSYIVGTKKNEQNENNSTTKQHTSFNKSSSRSEASTATTSLNSSSYDDIKESIEPQKEELHMDPMISSYQREQVHYDDALISHRHKMTVVPTDIKKNIAKVAAKKPSSSSSSYTSVDNGEELLVEFGETTFCRKWQSLIVDIIN